MRCVCHIFHKRTPAFACVESKTKLEIKAAPYANITFKNERGVPLVLDDEGNPTSDIIGGYMPVGWHFGFICNNPKIAYIYHQQRCCKRCDGE